MAEKKGENIIDYVMGEMRTFGQKPFNDVDSLVLSQLSYAHFNGLVGSSNENKKPVKLLQLLKAEYFKSMFGRVYNDQKTKELLFAMAASPRFREIELNFYEETTDLKVEEQFSSVTYLLPFNAAYVAFRGTDTTIIGWKEDFNMAFMQVVPSQRAAAAQLEKVANLIELPIMVGGHSKGGNLAIYAGAKCKKDTFERVTVIYSHDGPGFRKDVISSGGFDKAASKIKKTVPEFSVIGMLLQSQDNYNVVCSDESFLMQHDPFSWLISDGDFAYADGITGGASLINESVSEWLAMIDDKSRERFIDVLFQTIASSGVDVQSMGEERIKNAFSIVEAFREIDPDTRKFVFHTMNSLASLSVKSLRGRSKRKSSGDVKEIEE